MSLNIQAPHVAWGACMFICELQIYLGALLTSACNIEIA